MDDLLPKLTEASQSRIWAAFQQLNHKRRGKQIGLNECIRKAYVVCARELPHKSSVAMVVRYARALRWLPAYRQTRRYVRYFAGFAPDSPPSPDPPVQPIPEAEQRAEIARLVADLIQAPRAAANPTRYPVRAAWLQAHLVERNWTKHDLARYGGPDPKTTQKVLDGLSVREDVLRKIAEGLSARGTKVNSTDIPRK
jgi:hypothetical protein